MMVISESLGVYNSHLLNAWCFLSTIRSDPISFNTCSSLHSSSTCVVEVHGRGLVNYYYH